MNAAAAALDAAGISRQSLDHLLNHLSTSAPAPQPVRLLPALPAPGPRAPRTTVMLRNLPNNYTRNMVCTMMDKEGFRGLYDFIYLPIDFRSKANLGYAFINLIDEPKVQQFWQTFDGYTKWVLPSAKVCSVSWSGPHQGQQAHIDRYRDSPIMHGSVPDEFKPAIFAQGRVLSSCEVWKHDVVMLRLECQP
ncbi:ML4 [Symbiodinium pilosum]|uniref:ML4 protein n=1 Tax=Symbiodinium pilosum TaxID=2952 RepID=A0A812IS89_SYMPI|nr:ML4 [Symbiodinium pilosum]